MPRQTLVFRPQAALPGLCSFFTWWAAELAAVWPGRGRALPSRHFAVARFDGRTLQVVVDNHGRIETLGCIGTDRSNSRGFREAESLGGELRRRALKLVLRLDSELGLQAVDILPEMARRELLPILTHRLDQLTPWNAETAAFDILRIDPRAGGMLEVGLAVVPCHIVARAKALLAQHGLTADVTDLEIGEPLAAPTHDLGRLEHSPRLPRPVLALAGLVFVAAVTTGGVLSLGNAEQQRTLDRLRDHATALEGRLADLPALHARIRALDDLQRVAHERSVAQPSSLVVLESLSRALPDDAWIESLTLTDRRVTLSGYARNAARLPRLLEAVLVFEAARFVGPLTRLVEMTDDGQAAEMDRFSMEFVALPGRQIDADPSSAVQSTPLEP